MNRNALFFGLASVTALLGTVAACSSTTTTETIVDGGSTPADGSAGGKDAGKDTSTPVEVDSGNTTDPDDACKAEATQEACGQCCVTNHQSGSKVFQDSLLACACKGTGADGGVGACATECAATVCAATPANPDQACTTCLQGSLGQNGACNNAVASACTANADCVDQQKCVATCQNKP